MNATIRLDTDGNPYLVISYTKAVEGDSNVTAQQDAEELFFRKLKQNSGSFHIVQDRANFTKLLIAPGLQRPAGTTESRILVTPAPQEETFSDTEKQESGAV